MNMTKYIVYAFAALVLLLVGGVIRDYYRQPAITGAQPVVQEAPPTRDVAAAPVQIITRTIRVPVLTKPEQHKVEQKFHLDLNTKQLLTKVELPKAPYGGEAVVTAGPEGRVEVTVAPAPRPFFDLGGQWEVGGGLLYKNGEVGGRALVAKDLLRLGEVTIKAQANVDVAGGQTDLEASVLAVWRH